MNEVTVIPESNWYNRARGDYATTVAFAVTCCALLSAGRPSLLKQNYEDFLRTRTFSAAQEQIAAECSPSGGERAAFILLIIFCFPAAIVLAVISGRRSRRTCGVLVDRAKVSAGAEAFLAECKTLFAGWRVSDEDMPHYIERKAQLIHAVAIANPGVIPKSLRELPKVATDWEQVSKEESAFWQSLFAAANVGIVADSRGNSIASQVNNLARFLSSAEADTIVSLGRLEAKINDYGFCTSLTAIGTGPSMEQLQLLLRQILAWKAILAAKSELEEQERLAEATLSFRISSTFMMQKARLRSDHNKDFYRLEYFFYDAFPNFRYEQEKSSKANTLQEALKEIHGKGNFTKGLPHPSFEMFRDMADDLGHILFSTELFPNGGHSHVPWKDFCLKEPVYDESGSCTLYALVKAAGINFLSPGKKFPLAPDAKPIPAAAAKNLIDYVNAFRMALLNELENLEVETADGWRPIWDVYKEVCGKTVASARQDLSARIAELESLLSLD